MARDVRETFSKYDRDPVFAAEYLTDGLEEGDPEAIRFDLLTIAEAQSGAWGGPDIRPEPKQRMEDLLPEMSHLTLVALYKAVRALGLQLVVGTKAGAAAHLLSTVRAMHHSEIALEMGLHKQEVAAAYLTVCLEQGGESLIQVGLRNVIDSQHDDGMKHLAKKLRLPPEAVYEMISGKGRPKVTGFLQIIRGLGFALKITVPEKKAAKRKAGAKAVCAEKMPIAAALQPERAEA